MAGTHTPAPVKIAKTPEPPVFSTIAEERLHRKQRLASAFRLFAKFGFSEGVAGHITARDPELEDHFWVNPFGMHFAHIRVSDLVLVNEAGDVVEGGRLLDPLTQEACAVYQDHGLFSDYTGVVYDTSEGDRIAAALGNYKAAILQNHGLLTVGRTVDEAAWYFITMDRSCQSQMLAESVGKPIPIAHESALVAQQQVGNPRVGWFQYQPLWDLISREQPDLFD